MLLLPSFELPSLRVKIINDQSPVIYRIVNRRNGHAYIGSAVKFRNRQHVHLIALRTKRHHSQPLQRAWIKHGAAAFDFEVLEHVQNKADLLKREQHWLDTTKPYYNVSPTAGSPLGVRHSLETRMKFSRMRKGKRCGPENPHYGKRHSKEAKLKMMRASLGRHHTPESKAKLSKAMRGKRNPFYGKRHSKKTKEILRRKLYQQIEANGKPFRKGAKLSDEIKAKLSIARKSWWKRHPKYKRSAETCRKISEHKKAFYQNPENRNAVGERIKRYWREKKLSNSEVRFK